MTIYEGVLMPMKLINMEALQNGVTVVVPAYNVQEYITECLKSIVAQPEVAEILVIDDGSTDNTSLLVKDFVLADSRVKCIRKVNEGVSAARNLGIAQASCPYIMFVDADDVLSEFAVRKMLRSAKAKNSDMVYGNHAVLIGETVSQPSKEINRLSRLPLTSETLIKELFSSEPESLLGACWRLLFRTDFLRANHLEFPLNIHMSEDYYFIFDCFSFEPKVSLVEDIVYLVRRGNLSVTQQYVPSLEHDMMFVNNHLKEGCKGNEALMNAYHANVVNTAWASISNLYKEGSPCHGKEREQLVIEIISRYKESIDKMILTSGLPFIKAFLLKGSTMFPRLVVFAFDVRYGR